MTAFRVGPFRRAGFLVAVLVTLIVVQALAQQPLQPPAPEKYKIKLRYRIPAARDQHVKQYEELVEFLQGQKFEFDPPLEDRPPTDREDRNKDEFEGLVPGAGNPLRLLLHPGVASVQLVPAD